MGVTKSVSISYSRNTYRLVLVTIRKVTTHFSRILVSVVFT
jgi:hypothetical protein